MSAIKKSIVGIQIYRALKNAKKERGCVGYNKARIIGIIYSGGDVEKHDRIKQFIKTLEKDGKKVEVLQYLEKHQQNHEFLYDYFTEKDVSLWGNFKSENALAFLNKEFDFLFHLDMKGNTHVDNLLAKSNAKCRVGPYRDNKSGFYEMMIKTESESMDELINQIYHYTRSLI